jgi:hypothetical protein
MEEVASNRATALSWYAGIFQYPLNVTADGRRPHPVFVVSRHDETSLAREIETMEMVSL